jgi:hypothetical protein
MLTKTHITKGMKSFGVTRITYFSQGTRHIFSMMIQSLVIYILTFGVCVEVCNTSHNIKGSYSNFELPIETLQLIEETLEDLRLLDGDLPI